MKVLWKILCSEFLLLAAIGFSQDALTVSPGQLIFHYQIGGPIPNPQTFQVSGVTQGTEVYISSGGGWVSVNTTSATVPASISVSVNPYNLLPGNYFGRVIVTTNPLVVNAPTVNAYITLIVTGQVPTITSLVNAASFLNQAISPGEVVSIFGSGLGPATPLQLQLDSTGKVSTSLGNVQVHFDGYPAPLTYVSSTQINCVVPYEIGRFSSGNPSVQVVFTGLPSNLMKLAPQALTSPGIFATNGTGQAAVLNQDGSVNGPGSPESAGHIVSIFMTGAGQTAPPGVTGSVTCSPSCNTLQQIPVPVQPVTAVVGNQPATVTFYGEAPGLVAGVQQVNLIVPPNTPSGAVPLVISVGGIQSQSGVTLSVR